MAAHIAGRNPAVSVSGLSRYRDLEAEGTESLLLLCQAGIDGQDRVDNQTALVDKHAHGPVQQSCPAASIVELLSGGTQVHHINGRARRHIQGASAIAYGVSENSRRWDHLQSTKHTYGDLHSQAVK